MTELGFLGRLLLGLASSLHCAGMCAGIAGSLALLLAPAGRARWHGFAVAQLGRGLAYVLAGAVLGGFGAGFYGVFDHRGAFWSMPRCSMPCWPAPPPPVPRSWRASRWEHCRR